MGLEGKPVHAILPVMYTESGREKTGPGFPSASRSRQCTSVPGIGAL